MSTDRSRDEPGFPADACWPAEHAIGRARSVVTVDGVRLTAAQVAAVAWMRVPVAIAASARARMRAAATVVREAIDRDLPVYGLTTGLGQRVVQRLESADAAAFSLRTLRGRAMAVGEPLPEEVCRAAMVTRLSGLCAGGSGAAEAVADGLAGLLNRGVHPVIPESGSLGASDLCLLAHVGLSLIGEGEAIFQGRRMTAAQALHAAGLQPLVLGPRDGLAICSSSAVSAGAAALALLDAEQLLQAAQIAAALSMEGFRANLSPLDERVVAARPAPGQAWAAAALRSLLAGGTLTEPGAARRLQDPLSLRCAAPIHGALHVALGWLADALTPELAGAADNPLVLREHGEILSTGNFHAPALALALDAVAVALAQVANACAQRPVRCMTERLSELAEGLDSRGPGSSGLAPLAKTAEALALEIRHRAAPYAAHAAVTADGVEDHSTSAVQAALRVREQLERLRRLVALELVVGAQAVELAAPRRLGVGTAAAFAWVRESVAPLAEDRPMGDEVERLAGRMLGADGLPERVSAALAVAA